MADEPLVGLTDQVQYPLATPSKPARHKKNLTLKISGDEKSAKEISSERPD